MLDSDKNVIAADDPIEWMHWFKTDERVVGHDVLEGLEVAGKTDEISISTVFLGTDDHLGFETLILRNGDDIFTDRYQTWAEAEEAHNEIVSKFKYKLAVLKMHGDLEGSKESRANLKKIFQVAELFKAANEVSEEDMELMFGDRRDRSLREYLLDKGVLTPFGAQKPIKPVPPSSEEPIKQTPFGFQGVSPTSGKKYLDRYFNESGHDIDASNLSSEIRNALIYAFNKHEEYYEPDELDFMVNKILE
jgi:hypothetical protein